MMNHTIATARGMAMIIELVLMILTSATAPTTQPATAPASQPATTQDAKYIVRSVQGVAQYRLAGDGTWQKLKEGVELQRGDRIRTGPHAVVTIERPDGSTWQLDRLGTIEIEREPTRLPDDRIRDLQIRDIPLAPRQ